MTPVLGPGTVKVAIEAAVREGWDRYIGAGRRASSACTASAPARPYKDVYKHFGITRRSRGGSA